METVNHGTLGNGKGNWWNTIGVGVVSGFAALWAWMGAGALQAGTMAIRIAAIVISVILLAARAATITRNGPINRKLLVATIVGEVVALWIMGALLGRWARPDLLLPGLAIIVGLHFFPMAKAVGIPTYRMTAVTMSGLGIGSLALAQTPRTALVGLGCAIILWLTISRPLWSPMQQRGRNSDEAR